MQSCCTLSAMTYGCNKSKKLKSFVDFTWGIFFKKIKNQKNVLEIKVMSNILIKHLHDLLLKGFDNQDAYILHVVIITFSRK